jgi:dTDP-4-dehydrorhamnose reductase
MKILLLGKNGQVGWELQRSLAPLGELIALDRQRRPELCGRLQPARRPARHVRAVAPTSSSMPPPTPPWTRPRANPTWPACHQRHPRRAGPRSRGAAAPGCCTTRTDYVFDGSGSERPASEDATHRPAERLRRHQARRRAGSSRQRLPPPHPAHQLGVCRARRQLRQDHAQAGGRARRLTVIADQIGAPTGADLLADVTAHAARTRSAPARWPAPTTRGRWRDQLARLRLPRHRTSPGPRPDPEGPDAIDPVPTSAFPTPARRPLNSRLTRAKLRDTFGLVLPPWQQGVERMLRPTILP